MSDPGVREAAATLEAAIIAHVPDGYDQVDPDWEGALRRECLEDLKTLAAAAERAETLRALLTDAESVIFEGVREDALVVTGCETWAELMEDADEVRWRILGFLGITVVDRKFPRLARVEAAEAQAETLEAALAGLLAEMEEPRSQRISDVDRRLTAIEDARAALAAGGAADSTPLIPVVLNPDAIGDPNQSPVVEFRPIGGTEETP